MSYRLPALLSLVVLILVACNRTPYAIAKRVYRQQAKQLVKGVRKMPQYSAFPLVQSNVLTTNFNLRKPNYVIIHHTAQNSCAQTLQTFITAKTGVSAHYVICRDGTVHHMLNDYLRAWHAGVSKWGGLTDLNSVSLGIELDNNGLEPFAPAQINSLLVLLDTLKNRYNIPAANFIGHADIAPARKVDPSVHFPWKRLAQQGFGRWWSDTTSAIVPPGFDKYQALQLIGYETRDTLAVLRTFKMHFAADTTKGFTTADEKILFRLAYPGR